MLAGVPGSRPLDRAIAELEKDKVLAGADRWLLAFDPASRRTRLLPWKTVVGGLTGEAAVAKISSELAFFVVDYQVLGGLFGRGYRDLVLVTDTFPFEPRGFSVIEVGYAGPRAGPRPRPRTDAAAGGQASMADQSFEGEGEAAPAAWPTSARYDRTRGTWVVDIAEGGRKGGLSLRIFDEGQRQWKALASTRYAIEERTSGLEVTLTGPGLYLFRFGDPLGGLGVDLALRLAPARTAADARGDFSTLMLSVFPLLERAPRPRIVFSDLGAAGGPAAEALLAGSRNIRTALVDKEPYLADPGLSGGRPLASGLAKGADFAWGPAALANPDLPLVYDGAMEATAPPPFVTSFPAATKEILPAGNAWLAFGPEGTTPVDPPLGEFWEPSVSGTLALSPPDHRLLWALLLAAVLVAKYLTWVRLTGKRLFALAPET
jgi:hypothetical protein